MKTFAKQLLCGALSAALLTSSALAANIRPSTDKIELKPGSNTISFTISVTAETAFAGVEFGLQPSNSDVTFSKVEYLGEAEGLSNVDTVKNGVLYFGCFTNENVFAENTPYEVARVTYEYTGTADRTIALVSSNVITVNTEDKTTSGDKTSAPFTVTIEREENTGDGGSTPGGTTGGSSTGSQTETTTNPDGSTTTTVTKPDGSTTATTTAPDGSSSVVNTTKEGQVEAAVTVSSSAVENAKDVITLPMPQVSATADADTAPEIHVDLPAGTTAKVEIPVENVTAGTVAVLVKADGTEEVVKTSYTTENGVVVEVKDGDTVKIVDNSKDFSDVPATFWGADAVDFVTSRELFNGTSAATFSPNGAMNRAMIVTVLARLEGVDTSTGSTWYEVGRQWAMEEGISDGTNMMGDLTREQLAAMLYRYVGSPAVSGTITGFPDTASVSGWAEDAMLWAVQNGIISGSSGKLNPQGNATRAEVATMLMRFCQMQ